MSLIIEISLGIGDDRVTFDMYKKIHNFTTPIGNIYMINSMSNDESLSLSSTPSDESSRFEKSDNLHNENNHILEQTIKACNGGIEIYRMNEDGDLKRWYYYIDNDRGSIKGSGLSFPEFLLVKYREVQEKELIWDNRYKEWCNENSSPYTLTLKFTLGQEDYKPRSKDYPFKEWLLTKVGHTEVSEPVKKALLKTWLLDCFKEELVKDP
ncbi:hypothetical protein Tco_1072128 [Tanacetum coccineum]